MAIREELVAGNYDIVMLQVFKINYASVPLN